MPGSRPWPRTRKPPSVPSSSRRDVIEPWSGRRPTTGPVPVATKVGPQHRSSPRHPPRLPRYRAEAVAVAGQRSRQGQVRSGLLLSLSDRTVSEPWRMRLITTSSGPHSPDRPPVDSIRGRPGIEVGVQVRCLPFPAHWRPQSGGRSRPCASVGCGSSKPPARRPKRYAFA